MSKTSTNPIQGFNDDWGRDERNGLPYSGQAVQDFLKDNLRKAVEGIDTKFGAVTYEAGSLIFYDEDGGKRLASVTLTGTSYIVTVTSERPSAFYVLSNDETATIDLTPTTEAVEIGQAQRQPFPEDYTYSIEVDSGSGYIDRTPADNAIPQGTTKAVDVRRYLTTGINKIRIIVKGVSSDQPRTLVYTATLTSLTLSCTHAWEKAWIEGEQYGIGNILFGGNIAKTLHVMVGDRDYTQAFSASTSYINTPYTFDLSDKFPGTTGIHRVKVWIEGADVQTTPIEFSIMTVRASETATARLVCINNALSKAINYSTQTLFRYATYNVTEVTISITGMVGDEPHPIIVGQKLTTQTQVKAAYTTNLQLDTEIQTNLSLAITLSGAGSTQSVTMPLDNSNAFVATPGAWFYINPALRSNNTPDRLEIHNTAAGATKATYHATWSGFTFADDAHAADPEGHKALVVKAGSSLTIPDLKPLDKSGTISKTFEFMYRASNVADFDTPVFSIMNTATYSADTTRGIIAFPTRILVLSSNERQPTYQRIDLPEDRIIHVAIVLQRNFASRPYNLCRIFINGRENVAFQYSGTSDFTEQGTAYSNVRIGQASTDFYTYMIRCYDKALEGAEVFANYLNAMIDTAESSRIGERADNAIIDSGSINYDMVKKAGFNTYVVETDERIPSLDNPETSNLRVNLHLEYNDHPEWNVSIYNIPMDGQGTTSMKYVKWNLRDKIKSADTRWFYPNYQPKGRATAAIGLEEFGKDGYIAGHGLHPKVSTITAKKNVASSPQGHKMGATAFYHELFVACEGTDMLPNADCRVAVYQHPFVGFQKFSDGHYEFIGLYTVGPDKKDKKTFGYNETKAFPSLMMIEGPNHAPYMTRFLVPWTEDVFYDYAQETLSTGDSNIKQEGWDADIAADYSTDKPEDAAAIFALFQAEFKPAYDAIYYNSPYLASVAETGKTLDQINADIADFQTGTTNGIRNANLTLYTSDYALVYFRVKTGRYEVLPKSTHDMLDYLGFDATDKPTTTQLLARRAEQWKDRVFEFVSKQEALFHESFCDLLGVSDNHAKNTYWRKFQQLLKGGKWGFNQDDLDTLFQNDNNGQDTKEYYIEPDDTNLDGGLTFQGSDSAFWYALRQHCQTELRDKMLLIVQKAVELAGKYKVEASTTQGSLFNLIGYYFWSHSAKYFPATAYNEDSLFAYINVWLKDPSKAYNNVFPLTQVHGDHYETERAWVERRIAYTFSKYRIGGFTGTGGDGYGTLEFTPGATFPLRITPAIAMYPRMTVGSGDSGQSQRTMAGQAYTITLPASTDTGIYIKGMELISDLGDLSQLTIASRGGSDEISLAISGRKLRRLKVGDQEAENVKFNATTLTVSGPSIEEIDARNASSIKGTLRLFDTPRLKRAYLSGTSLGDVKLPVGGRVNAVQMPATLNTLFLHSLNLLQPQNLTIPDEAWRNITDLYFNECSQINPLEFVHGILSKPDNVLQFVTLIWSGERAVNSNDVLDAIAALATKPGVGALDFDGQELQRLDRTPDIQGTAQVNVSAYEDTIYTIKAKLPNLKIITTKPFFVRFKDPEVLRVLLANAQHSDPNGLTKDELAKITDIGEWFKENKDIRIVDFIDDSGVRKFPDKSIFEGCSNLEYFSSNEIKTIGTSHYCKAFLNCTSLKGIWAPKAYVGDYFQNGTSYSRSFGGCTSLAYCFLGSAMLGQYLFYESNVGVLDITNVTRINSPLLFGTGVKYCVMRNTEIAELYSGSHGSTPTTFFVVSSLLQDWKSLIPTRTFEPIGGEIWQSAMRSLAEQYAAEYAGWSAEQIASEDYSDPNIDYRIFGVDPPTDD